MSLVWALDTITGLDTMSLVWTRDTGLSLVWAPCHWSVTGLCHWSGHWSITGQCHWSRHWSITGLSLVWALVYVTGLDSMSLVYVTGLDTGLDTGLCHWSGHHVTGLSLVYVTGLSLVYHWSM